MLRAALVLLAVAACQGQRPGGGQGSASGAPPRDAAALDAADESAAVTDPDARPRSDEPELPDPGRVIAELGAIPAWQAVVERAQLLGRRGQRGVVFGRVGAPVLVPPPPSAPPVPSPGTRAAGPPTDGGVHDAPGATSAATSAATNAATDAATGGGAIRAPGAGLDAGGLIASPYVWLIDDTEGNGALAIWIALGDRAREGDRIAVSGAWQLDAERRWFWKPEEVHPLPPATPSDLKDAPRPPGHAIATGELPSGARTISAARDGDAVYFQIVGPAPASEGDGWQIADQLGDAPVAVLNLPGERASYGGHDLRAAGERWQLRRGVTYWVRIGKLRKRGPDKPTYVNARTAPVRVL